MRFGIVTDQHLPWPNLVERWQLFERLGFDSLVIPTLREAGRSPTDGLRPGRRRRQPGRRVGRRMRTTRV